VRQIRTLTITLLLLLGTAILSFAAPSEEPVNLSAESLVLDQESGLYRARGDVVIEQGELRLKAGAADWDQKSGAASCYDGVSLESADGIMTGERLQYDFTTGLGLLENGSANLKRHGVYLSGDRIEKRGEISYRVTGGSFTTCEGEKPAWQLTAGRLDVDIEGYARARHAVFYLRDFPVLYLPFIALPAKTERQSGLLFPEIGHSSRFGDRIIQPYYLVIDDHIDATLSVDYMSDFGLGSGLEFRYLMRQSRPGRLYGNYISGLHGEPDRLLAEWFHDGMLPGKVRLVADVEYVDRKDYFSIFGGNADVYASEKSQSTLFMSRAWNKTVLAGQAKYTRDLEGSSATQLQYLPELRFDYLPQRAGHSPLFFSLTADSAYLWHRDGLKGNRTTLQPAISSDLLVGGYLEVVPTLAWQHRFYDFDNQSEEEGVPIAALDVGSRFSRLFRVNGKRLTHIRHAVEPLLHYRYIPKVDQSNLPQLDTRDRIDPENVVTFELMNRFTARLKNGESQARFLEFASLRLAVDYDIHEERREIGPAPDKNRPFYPLRGELILRPNSFSFLRGDIAYDANSDVEEVESWAVRGEYDDRDGNGIKIDYTYRRDDFDYISGEVETSLLDPLFLSYGQRYDFENREKREEVVQAEYRSQCWNITVSYRDRPNEQQVDFLFSLSGLTDSGRPKSVFSR